MGWACKKHRPTYYGGVIRRYRQAVSERGGRPAMSPLECNFVSVVVQPEHIDVTVQAATEARQPSAAQA